LPFPQFLLHPVKYAPWFTPDESNFTDKLIWAWLRPRAIPIRRDKGGGKEPLRMLRVLDEFDEVIVTQPECGRTRNGKKFQFSKSGQNKIRPLANYIGWLAVTTQKPVLRIWIGDGEAKQPTKKLFSRPDFKRPIIVKIGKLIDPISLGISDPDDFTKLIAEKLLELADQEC